LTSSPAKALIMRAERSITADQTVAALEALVARRGRAPAFLRCDNGPELTSHALGDWCRFSRAQTAFIEPGAPWQNPYVESFHSRVRDELLDGEEFSCLAEARVLIADWRQDYNPLCRRRHKCFYADVGVMPTWGRDRLVGAVIGAWRSV
jgi:transposase InsO family protein